MDFVEGDVVFAHVPFEDGTGTKKRPVVILRVIKKNPETRYVVAECYSDKEHYGKNKGILIKEGTEDFISMGIKENTFITDSIKGIYHRMIIKQFGTFPRIEWLKEKLR